MTGYNRHWGYENEYQFDNHGYGIRESNTPNGISGCSVMGFSNTISFPNPPTFDISDDIVDKLWEKLSGRPVIVPCPFCKSHNAITNPACVQCGGPLGA